MYPPSRTPTASAASVPSPSRLTMNSLISVWNAIPAPIATPAQITTPRPFSSKRSEEHTSELQSQFHLVCRLLLEKKKNKKIHTLHNTDTNTKAINSNFYL